MFQSLIVAILQDFVDTKEESAWINTNQKVLTVRFINLLLRWQRSIYVGLFFHTLAH
jgi:hypothetical protein